MQNPYNFTRLRCCTADIIAISVTNWLFPWWDTIDSCFTAITLPSLSFPLYTGPNPPSPSLLARLKSSVAVFSST
uniref:Uncharacterized protein n=1 Tax=Rhizophora mucronata TaxID=61149 RepID=A0A2P2MWK3_RHIMU